MANSIELNPKGNVEPKVEKMSVDQAMTILWGIFGEVHRVGANDTEPSELLSLIEKVQSRKMDPEEGVRIAKEIQSNKQDYH